MFSKDNRHYRPTPRSVSEAFGPYHCYDIDYCRKHERLIAIAGVLIVGVILGLLFGWRG